MSNMAHMLKKLYILMSSKDYNFMGISSSFVSGSSSSVIVWFFSENLFILSLFLTRSSSDIFSIGYYFDVWFISSITRLSLPVLVKIWMLKVSILKIPLALIFVEVLENSDSSRTHFTAGLPEVHYLLALVLDNAGLSPWS